jgi:hypothetical protein
MQEVGTMGNTILFFCSIVGMGIVGLYVLGYAAHCFLVVLDQTAWGTDRVTWPDEPVFDWLWKPFFLIWMVGFWVVPVWLLLGWLGPALFQQFPALTLGQALVGSLWLLFPLSVLSALSSASRWTVLRFGLLRRVIRHPVALAFVYAVGGVLVVGAAWLAQRAVLSQRVLLPVAALAGAAAVLLYARLLGRLGWLLIYRTPVKEPKAAPRKQGKKKKRRPSNVTAYDPWAIPDEEPDEAEVPADPPEEEDEWAPPKPYGLQKERPASSQKSPPPAEPAAAPAQNGYVVDENVPLAARAPLPLDGFAPVGLKPPPKEPLRLPRVAGEPAEERPERSPLDELEERLRAQADEVPPELTWPLVRGVFSFLLYPTTLRPWLYLSTFMLALGGLAWLAVVTCPL